MGMALLKSFIDLYVCSSPLDPSVFSQAICLLSITFTYLPTEFWVYNIAIFSAIDLHMISMSAVNELAPIFVLLIVFALMRLSSKHIFRSFHDSITYLLNAFRLQRILCTK